MAQSIRDTEDGCYCGHDPENYVGDDPLEDDEDPNDVKPEDMCLFCKAGLYIDRRLNFVASGTGLDKVLDAVERLSNPQN